MEKTEKQKKAAEKKKLIAVILLILGTAVIGRIFLVPDEEEAREATATMIRYGRDGSICVDAELEAYDRIYNISEDGKCFVYQDDSTICHKAEDTVTVISNTGKVLAVSRDCNTVFYANGEEELRQWTPEADTMVLQELQPNEALGEYHNGMLSENEQYLAIAVDTAQGNGVIYLTDIETAEAVLIESHTKWAELIAVSNDGEVIYRQGKGLYYADKNTQSVISENSFASAVYEEAGKIIYLDGDGRLFLRSVGAQEDSQLLDEGVNGLWSLGRIRSYNWWDIAYTGSQGDYERAYGGSYANHFRVTETDIHGAMYTKEGGTWYCDLDTGACQFLMEEAPDAVHMEFASEDLMYYGIIGSTHKKPSKLYMAERKRDGWERTYIADVKLVSDIRILDNGDMVVYRNENDTLCAYTNDRKIVIAEAVDYFWASDTGTQVLYEREGSIYFQRSPGEKSIHITNEALWDGDPWYGEPFYYEEAIYYMTEEQEIIKASTDGRNFEVLLKDAEWFDVYWKR